MTYQKQLAHDVDLGTIRVRDLDIPVTLTTGGMFRAELDEQTVSSETLDGLQSNLMTKTRRAAVKVETPATRDGRLPERVTITGLHARTGHILYRDSRGKAQTSEARGYGSTWLVPLDDAGIAKWVGLKAARDEAKEALWVFERTNELNVRNEVEAAIQAAMAKEDGKTPGRDG